LKKFRKSWFFPFLRKSNVGFFTKNGERDWFKPLLNADNLPFTKLWTSILHVFRAFVTEIPEWETKGFKEKSAVILNLYIYIYFLSSIY
jgi:hypothetical protein